ncbi:hypothetical protein FHR95_003376 [Halomonas fontilapidosi]|uniref:Uncharacterized protein n=1 Tax=Halomonas fontilapidosi TaxID=616675 RepID=A0A7W5DNG5_9GAMM|nr:hypothetical protein [Halomonas fontilapidosi]MBB3185783.1 hypothetical protein [Halomonas fontilapidosi]
MPIYELPCSDGTDRHCTGTVEVPISIERLTAEQLKEIQDSGGTRLTPAQLASFELDDQERKELKEFGSVYFDIDIDDICDPCGSDQTYDDEGNNISAL